MRGFTHVPRAATTRTTAPVARPSPARPQVRNILRGLRVQPKLRVGAPNDPAEREADRVADQVMRMPDPAGSVPEIAPIAPSGPGPLRRLCAECEEEVRRQPVEEDEELLQAKAGTGRTPEVTPEVAAGIASLRGRGEPLPASERAFFEPRFGHDFSEVRLHADARAAASADALAARAYTVGRDIVLASGQFSPQTASGRKLLAHELAHVVQQRHDGMALQRQQPPGSTPPACPTDIKVVKLYHIPLTPQGVTVGNLTGGGAIAEMEVSDPANKDWAGTQIRETTTTVAETCGTTKLCGNVGQGGAAGSTWPIPDPLNALGLSLPAKRNTFYDWHFSHMNYDVLSHEGVKSCESECEQTYDCVGGGPLSPKFSIQRRLTPDTIGSQAVTQIAVTKPAK